MAKVTSKLQVTVPKAIAREYCIEPGDEIEFQAAGDVIRVLPPKRRHGARLNLDERLRLFDRSTGRQAKREKRMPPRVASTTERGWCREDLYARGEPD